MTSLPANPSGSQTWWRDYVADREYGALPALLLVLTVSTGVVDAVSILKLGRVFVANMTGNVVFIGFALAGAPGFSLAASLIALGGFLLGARLGGLAVRRRTTDRRRLLCDVTAAEFVLVGLAAAVATLAGTPLTSAVTDWLVVLVALGLGIQNAAVRHLAVPDLTTSVLTMTLTGIAADLRAGRPRVVVRRALSVAAMLAGAYVGALLALDVGVSAGLWLASALIGVVLVGAATLRY